MKEIAFIVAPATPDNEIIDLRYENGILAREVTRLRFQLMKSQRARVLLRQRIAKANRNHLP